MRFANIRELKLETNKVLALSARGESVIITRRNRPVAVLRSITEDDVSLAVGPLWSRLRSSAEQAGYDPRKVAAAIRSVRAGKQK